MKTGQGGLVKLSQAYRSRTQDSCPSTEMDSDSNRRYVRRNHAKDAS